MRNQFVCEDALHADQIEAAIDDGVLLPWRIDADGRQWFRRIQAIRAIPPERVGGDDGDD